MNLGHYMTSYPSPSYDPYRNISPYDPCGVQGQSGAVAEMQRRHRDLLRQSEARRFERYRLETLDGSVVYIDPNERPDFYEESHRCTGVFCSTCGVGPEEILPSVEYSRIPIEAPQWWINLWSDPIWEIFRRPSIK